MSRGDGCLNNYADNDDLIYCTYRINGGFNGYRRRETKVTDALTAIKSCRNTDLSMKGTYTLATNTCNNMSDAVYKWANLIHGEGINADEYYQRYLELTDDAKQTNTIKSRRITAGTRIKKSKIAKQ